MKSEDEIYCRSCGKIIKKEAVICPHCAVPLRPDYQRYLSGAKPKDKTVAILLSVFLGLWAWLYTYQKNSWKFWLNLVLSLITIGIWGIVAWIWAIVDHAPKPEQWYLNYPNE